MTEDQIARLFSDVAAEPGTQVLNVSHLHLAGKPVRMELWLWEGIIGQTVVFRAADVADLVDESLFDLVRSEIDVKGQMTVKRSGQFVFVNHSFSST